jgi:hypothetical protein
MSAHASVQRHNSVAGYNHELAAIPSALVTRICTVPLFVYALRMSKHTKLYLTDEQRSHLENLIRSGSAPARTQTKVRILLVTDRTSGLLRKDAEIAESVMVNVATVGRTRRVFISIRHGCCSV